MRDFTLRSQLSFSLILPTGKGQDGLPSEGPSLGLR